MKNEVVEVRDRAGFGVPVVAALSVAVGVSKFAPCPMRTDAHVLWDSLSGTSSLEDLSFNNNHLSSTTPSSSC
jgi:hypothetical protein